MIKVNRKNSKKNKKSFSNNEAYLRGVQDFHKGSMDNPYRKHTYYWKEWTRGFNEAYFENLAIYS